MPGTLSYTGLPSLFCEILFFLRGIKKPQMRGLIVWTKIYRMKGL